MFCSKHFLLLIRGKITGLGFLREQYLSSVSYLNSKYINSKAFHLDRVRGLWNHPQELRRSLQSPVCKAEMELIMNLAVCSAECSCSASSMSVLSRSLLLLLLHSFYLILNYS